MRFIPQQRPGLDHALTSDAEFHIRSANPANSADRSLEKADSSG